MARPPAPQPDIPDFPAACPVDYRKLAHRCLQKQPHNRLHSSQVVQRLQEMLTTFRAAAAAAPPAGPLPPLPLGGPDESALPAAAAGALFGRAQQPPAGAAATAPRALPVGVPTAAPTPTTTPSESRHKPISPRGAAAVPAMQEVAVAAATPQRGAGAGAGGGAGAGARADVSPEISPWAANDSPRVGAAANGERRKQ
jgi:hypothetical protein